MNYVILIVMLIALVIYLLASFAFVPLMNFKYHDSYDDEDLIYGPNRPDWIPEGGLLIDLHTHTTASDGVLTPRQLVLWHISNGYDGLCVTDHNTMEAVEECKRAAREIDPDFIIIPGIEFTTMRVHLNLIGIKSPMKKPNLIWIRKKTIRNAIHHAHNEGGLAQFNHKEFYPHNQYLPREWYLANKIDGWEVYNGFGFVDEDALSFIEENRKKRIMFAGAGTDVHDPAKHYRVYTRVLTEDRSVEGVLQALREGKSEVYMNKEEGRGGLEKGKIKINCEKQRIIRRWRWLNWAGYALFVENKAHKVVSFIISYLITMFIATILF